MTLIRRKVARVESRYAGMMKMVMWNYPLAGLMVAYYV